MGHIFNDGDVLTAGSANQTWKDYGGYIVPMKIEDVSIAPAGGSFAPTTSITTFKIDSYDLLSIAGGSPYPMAGRLFTNLSRGGAGSVGFRLAANNSITSPVDEYWSSSDADQVVLGSVFYWSGVQLFEIEVHEESNQTLELNRMDLIIKPSGALFSTARVM